MAAPKPNSKLQTAQQQAAAEKYRNSINQAIAQTLAAHLDAARKRDAAKADMTTFQKLISDNKKEMDRLASLPPPVSKADQDALVKVTAAWSTDYKTYQDKKKQYDDAVANVAATDEVITRAKNQLLASYDPKWKAPATSSALPKGGGPSKPDNGAGTTISYKYNAPMVTEAYLGKSIQSQMLGKPGLITSASFESTLDPWKDGKSAKGVIRMSKHFADIAPKPNNSNAPGNKGSSQIYDSTPYGMRFLYNPGTVSMAWGIVDSFSPQFESAGLDKAQNVSVGLMKSAITFSLMLNRIGDMSYINSQGNIKNVFDNLAQLSVDAAEALNTNALLLNSIPGVDKVGLKTVPTNAPYPNTVDQKELQLIWNKGTMYDIEYLFRATGGYSSQYKSTLNGPTADKGWLQPIPVELHLGDGMRYLVRISSLDLQHLVFNERMVPVVSTVNITCTRYFDGPEMFTTVSTSSTTAGLSTNDVFGAATTSAATVTK